MTETHATTDGVYRFTTGLRHVTTVNCEVHFKTSPAANEHSCCHQHRQHSASSSSQQFTLHSQQRATSALHPATVVRLPFRQYMSSYSFEKRSTDRNPDITHTKKPSKMQSKLSRVWTTEVQLNKMLKCTVYVDWVTDCCHQPTHHGIHCSNALDKSHVAH